MKNALAVLLLILLVTSAAAAQDSSKSGAKKPKASSVDCSGIDDAAITASVQDRLSKAPSLKDLTINVATSGGVVTLTGSAKTGRQKGTVTRVAKSAPCAKKIDNQLTVESSTKTAAKN